MSATNERPGNWPWDWDFRNSQSFSRGRTLGRQDSHSRSSSILSDCLSEASRQHEKDASLSRSASVSGQQWNSWTPSPESPWVPASPIRTPSSNGNHETTTLSQVNMWLSDVPSQASMTCPICKASVKTTSELKKHELRHKKPYFCTYAGCTRTEGFRTSNDLDRHRRSKHVSELDPQMAIRYKCLVPGCKSKEKTWPRLDNFRSHLKRVHHGEYSNDHKVEEMAKRCEVTNGLLQATTLQASVTASPSPVDSRQTFAESSSPITLPQPVGSSRSACGVSDNTFERSSPSGQLNEERFSDIICAAISQLVTELHRDICNVQKDNHRKPLDPSSQINPATKRQLSGNTVSCEICHSFQGRPSELRKHMKRHERPYGCTFLACRKTFGSKNDWKRHENSQHFHMDLWRCNTPFCSKLYYTQQKFRDHLSTDHDLGDDEEKEAYQEACHIRRNVQKRFWCGFCRRTVDLRSTGIDACTERFDHIDDHFMGRNGEEKRRIETWMPVNMPSVPMQATTQVEGMPELTNPPLHHTQIQYQRGIKRKASPAAHFQRNAMSR